MSFELSGRQVATLVLAGAVPIVLMPTSPRPSAGSSTRAGTRSVVSFAAHWDRLVQAVSPTVAAQAPPITYGTDGGGNPTTSDCTSFVSPGNSIQSAVTGAPSGSVICVEPGDYSAQQVRLSGSGVVLRSIGAATVRSVVVEGSANTLDGFTVAGGPFNNPAIGIEFRGTNQRILRNLVRGRGIVHGIRCNSCGSGHVLADNTVNAVHNYGIWINGGQNITVERSNIYDIWRSTNNTDVDAMRFWGTNHLIRNNYVHDINQFKSARSGSGDTPHVDCFQTYQQSGLPVDNVVFENNYCVRVSRQCLIAENNQTASYQIRNVVFRGNVCETFDSQTINIKSVSGFTFENNLIMGGVRFQVLAFTNVLSNLPIQEIRLRNNIVMKGLDSATYYQNNVKRGVVVDDRNLYVQNSVVVDDANAFHATSNVTYPAFRQTDFTRFRALAGSLDVVDRGVPVPALLTDIDGRPRVAGAAIDISPFEQGGPPPPPPGCRSATAGGPWVNGSFPARTGAFTVRFDAKPSASPLDSVVGLSAGPASAYTRLAVIARFNPSGRIDARDGPGYQAASAIPYVAGETYRFRLEVDLPNHQYSAFVTAPGGAEQVIGLNHAFRSEQGAVSQLDNVSIYVGSTAGANEVCNLTVSP